MSALRLVAVCNCIGYMRSIAIQGTALDYITPIIKHGGGCQNVLFVMGVQF